MIDILSKDKNFMHLTPFICSRTSKGALNYPTPQISRLKKILNYLQYMPFLKIKSKLYKFCILSNAERIICSTKNEFFDEIFGKFWLFQNNFGSFGSNFKTTSG